MVQIASRATSRVSAPVIVVLSFTNDVSREEANGE